ncbi:MAG: phosphate ABC transporter permease PstA, partial [Verrucomicrobiia bacterium]
MSSQSSEIQSFETGRRDWISFFFSGVTGLATLLILAILAVILGNITLLGWEGLSWRFVTAGTEQDMFNINTAGVMPMIVGTSARVILMSIFVIPIGVITAVY